MRGPSGGFVEPGPRLTLRFGNFVAAHFFGDIGAALLAFPISGECGEIEPFMRLDQIHIDSAATG